MAAGPDGCGDHGRGGPAVRECRRSHTRCIMCAVPRLWRQRVRIAIARVTQLPAPPRPPLLFSSYAFILLFLPCALLGYTRLVRHGPARASVAWLVACSAVYYGWWQPRYLVLLGGSVLVNYAAGRAIHALRGRAAARTVLIAGIASNMSLLSSWP